MRQISERPRTPSWVRQLIVSAILLMSSFHAHATHHALLVGVSTYPNLPERAWLKGPANDVLLMQDVLKQWGFNPENITELSEHQSDESKPSRANILAAFADLTDRVDEDDFVFIYMAGHGAQLPATDATVEHEPDGLDEVFLPRDVTGWGGAGSSAEGVSNVLRDDEVGQLLSAIRRKGAEVWIVFDSCHSGTMTRNASTDVVSRWVSADDLGVPQSAMEQARTRAGSGDDPDAGAMLDLDTDPGLIQFFAAQSHQVTNEMTFPPRVGKKYGMFTYNLVGALSAGTPTTYRQLAQYIQSRYRANPLFASTPAFRGDLDRGVFGGESGEFQAAARFTQGELDIAAGELHDFTEGSLLAILSSPTDDIDDALGFARVTSAKAMTSKAVPEAHAGLPALKAEQFPRTAYVRMVAPAFNPAITMAMLPLPDSLSNELNDQVWAALQSAGNQPDTPLGRLISPLSSAEGADYLLYAQAFRGVEYLYFLTPGQPLPCELADLNDAELDTCQREQRGQQWVSIGFDELTADGIRAAVLEGALKISRARNLIRLSQRASYEDSSLTMDFLVQRDGESEFQRSDESTMERLSVGSRIRIDLKNQDPRKAMRAHLFFIGSDMKIAYAKVITLSPGEDASYISPALNAKSTGREFFLVLAEPADNQSVTHRFSHLKQDGLLVHKGELVDMENRPYRGGPSLTSLLLHATGLYDDPTRGQTDGQETIRLFGWETLTD